MFSDEHYARTKRILARCRSHRLKIVTAESCTGGLIAALLTEIPGSSDVFERGFITYSNEAKTDMLGVPADQIQQHGAVSREVAMAMAEGAIAHSHATISISVTGVAGPGGGSAEKPLGLVWIASGWRGGATNVYSEIFKGDRQDIRLQAVMLALRIIEGRVP